MSWQLQFDVFVCFSVMESYEDFIQRHYNSHYNDDDEDDDDDSQRPSSLIVFHGARVLPPLVWASSYSYLLIIHAHMLMCVCLLAEWAAERWDETTARNSHESDDEEEEERGRVSRQREFLRHFIWPDADYYVYLMVNKFIMLLLLKLQSKNHTSKQLTSNLLF